MLRQIKTENGWVKGLPAADPRVTVFKGIPFAAPPVGENRWREPQPAANWDGVLNCFDFGPIPMQAREDRGEVDITKNNNEPARPMSEDCLQLNVWTPTKTGDEKLPVFVWIFGGAFMYGSTSRMGQDGERLARRGMVVVTMSYRVNVFSWFAHKELTAAGKANGEHYGDFGFLDQQAALKWIQRNIAAFGGDPDNVTLGGLSAGAGSTIAHLVSPESAGLFHRAVVMSGGGIRGYGEAPNMCLEDAEKKGADFIEYLGLSSVDEARKLSADELLEKGLEFIKTPGHGPRWEHFVDGQFLPYDWTEAFVADKRNRVPVLAGHTTNDFRWPRRFDSLEALKADAEARFGDKADEYLKLIDFDCGDLKKVIENSTYPLQEEGSANWARYNAHIGGAPFYTYTFDGDIPGTVGGAPHGSDLMFVFESIAKSSTPFQGKHYDLSRQMCNYWSNFIKTGDPNGLDSDGTPLPEWKAYTLDNPYEMYFGDTVGMMDHQPELIKFLVDYSVGRYLEDRANGKTV